MTISQEQRDKNTKNKMFRGVAHAYEHPDKELRGSQGHKAREAANAARSVSKDHATGSTDYSGGFHEHKQNIRKMFDAGAGFTHDLPHGVAGPFNLPFRSNAKKSED